MGRIWAIAKKDIRIYYSKGPVVIFGILFPVFLFLAFFIGRDLPLDFMLPGLLGMVVFFTATAISPAVAPWEAQARTLERLMSCPVTFSAIILGDIVGSFAFGATISLILVVISLAIGVIALGQLPVLIMAVLLAAFCFSSLGLIFSAAPTSLPSTTMMVSSMVKFPLVFISGIFIPLSDLPVWGQAIAYVSPLTYFTDIARHCIQNAGHLALGVDFLAMVAFTALFLLLAMKLHQKTMPKRI
ncbi:MAG: ABC transporter permease [Chloroflexi bacterium]|nr:MAG: ABC transporter permease [Chloroflexota bacterium]